MRQEMAMSAAPGRFDGLLMQLAQQSGGVEPLLDCFFDFLHRKTDFYAVTRDPRARKMGFLPGQAQHKLLEAFRKYPLRDLDGGSSSHASAESHVSAPAAKAEAKAKAPTSSNQDQAGHQRAAAASASTPAPQPKPTLTAEGKQVPVGNGGATDTYTWTQTLEDVSIQVELPEPARAKDLDVRLESSRVRVALKKSPSCALLEGQLPEKIRADESIWSLENHRSLSLSLEKLRPTWWASALRGDAEIDTSQVDSRRHIQDYDAATQGAIRKAVFDQRQAQAQGPPMSSEEQMLQAARDLPGSPFRAAE